MICPSCKKNNTKVLDSRDEKILVRRRRECLGCKHRFTTFERIETPRLKVVKRSDCKVDYEHAKLEKGIRLALEKRPFSESEIEDIVSSIEHKILKKAKDKVITSKQIGDMVTEKLRHVDEVAYIRFVSVYKKFGSAKKFSREIEKLNR